MKRSTSQLAPLVPSSPLPDAAALPEALPKALPESLPELIDWLRHRPDVSAEGRERLVEAVTRVVERQDRLWQQSKDDALQAMAAGFADRMRRMRAELAAQETTVASITRYFEVLVADLTDRADRDPKTRLMNFQRFLDRLQAFLGLDQRSTWCAVGLVDIRAFKQYNDRFGHALGDMVIDRVARLLRDHVRAHDVVAQEAIRDGKPELHARFGGDEFCFLLPRLDTPRDGWVVAERFREAVRSFDWSLENEQLVDSAVQVDVGVACLRLGPLEVRRPLAARLAQDLLAHADRAMYQAKAAAAAHVRTVSLHVAPDGLSLIDDTDLDA
jgi:diguanylate cyclase (GGDEF)-like protein